MRENSAKKTDKISAVQADVKEGETCKKKTKRERIRRFLKNFREYQLYLMLLPGLVYLVLFEYLPIFGISMAFQKFNPVQGFFGSEWVGFYQFERFVQSPLFWRLIKNTLSISLFQLAVFPVPIIFALVLNEMRSRVAKRTAQTIMYASHFISVVVLVGIMFTFFSPINGVINNIRAIFGAEPIDYMQNKNYFVPMFVLSGLWQNCGWNSIIYVGALANVDPCLHEAAMIDGAGRLRRIWSINLPAVIPTAVILFIMAVGNVMSVGFDKAFLMQTPGNLEVSNIISTYVYEVSLRSGLGDYSFGTAISLFNAVINLILLFGANFISKKLGQESLW